MFANLGSIHFLNKILGSDADGLILELGIEGEQSESLKIGILLPGGRQVCAIAFSNHIFLCVDLEAKSPTTSRYHSSHT